MHYYLCVKEQEKNENPYSISANMFITYTFGNTVTNQYVSERQYEFSLGYIYRTSVDKLIKDSNGRPHSIEKVSEYLRPYEFKLDEDAERLIKLKKEKGDYIDIHPIKVNENGLVTYECECRTMDRRNRLHHNFVILTMPQADVIKECYRIMRKRDKNTEFWRDFFFQEIRTYRLRKRLEEL